MTYYLLCMDDSCQPTKHFQTRFMVLDINTEWNVVNMISLVGSDHKGTYYVILYNTGRPLENDLIYTNINDYSNYLNKKETIMLKDDNLDNIIDKLNLILEL